MAFEVCSIEIQSVEVSDTTSVDSSNIACSKNHLSRFKIAAVLHSLLTLFKLLKNNGNMSLK
jgi:hypothetical protein